MPEKPFTFKDLYKARPTPSPSAPSSVTETSLVVASSEIRLVPEMSQVSQTSLVNETNLNLAEYAETLDYRPGHVRLNNDFFDKVLTQLEGDEQLLYFHLYRLRQDGTLLTIRLNWPMLAKRTRKSASTCQRAARAIEKRGLIEKADYSFGKGKEQGFRFRLVIPTSLSSQPSLFKQTSLVTQTDNKRIKE